MERFKAGESDWLVSIDMCAGGSTPPGYGWWPI